MVIVLVQKYILTFWCLVSVLSITSQNLVKNPSFEEYVNCPKRLGNFNDDVKFWSVPTIGSTDYFNECSTTMGAPKNFNGSQAADFGKGYAGLYLYAPGDYREYLQAELTETLVKGEKYRISFYISLAERSDFAIKEFGVLFSKHRLEVPIKKELSKKHIYQQPDYDYNFFEISYSKFYSDTQDWILVHSEFVAKGTEEYMILGNFKKNVRTRMFKTKRNAKQGAYYYIDRVLLEAVKKSVAVSGAKTAVQTKEIYELDKVHVFENVLFDFDKFRLLQTAKTEMKKIVDYVKSDGLLRIFINGHTDNVGSKSYNQILSNHRAGAVADYLQQLGLPEERIIWQGHGSRRPVADNASKLGRHHNRRVEFLITKSDSLR